MHIDYDRYARFVATVCDSNDLTTFKSHPDYQYMLEHVTSEHGRQYLDLIGTETTLSMYDIKDFCAMNSLGKPVTADYYFTTTSPTNLRYIYHAHRILMHLQSLNLPEIHIVELGGGYGGLCLAVHYFAPHYSLEIDSYTIVDLPAPSKLQAMYIEKVNPDIHVNCVDGSTYGASVEGSDMFLISNYCFSEIADVHQKGYIQHLFPKVSHGFMAWNHIPTYNFGFPFEEEAEVPATGGAHNKYVYF